MCLYPISYSLDTVSGNSCDVSLQHGLIRFNGIEEVLQVDWDLQMLAAQVKKLVDLYLTINTLSDQTRGLSMYMYTYKQ